VANHGEAAHVRLNVDGARMLAVVRNMSDRLKRPSGRASGTDSKVASLGQERPREKHDDNYKNLHVKTKEVRTQ